MSNNSTLQNNLIAYSIRSSIIEYKQFKEAIGKIAMLHQRSRYAGNAGGLMITGFTGSGKSTVKEQYASQYSRYETATGTIIPVLTVNTPSNPTVKSLVTAMLVAIGDPASHQGNMEEKTNRLYTLLKNCMVELLIIDEFQHFVDRGRNSEMMGVTDWLKNFINSAKIPVVIMGLPRSHSVLMLNEQLRRRFSTQFSMDPFQEATESFTEFRCVLNEIHAKLPIACVSLSDSDMAFRFLVATHGLIDFVVKMIDGAIEFAIQRGLKEISLRTLESVYREAIWKTCPDQHNPFCKSAKLRWLSNPGEPFDFVRKELESK